jgi:excisionase family DNA binding protein
MNVLKLLTPRETAKILGVGYPTRKQWICKRKIQTVQTARGHHRIPEKEIDRTHLHTTNRNGILSVRFPF